MRQMVVSFSVSGRSGFSEWLRTVTSCRAFQRILPVCSVGILTGFLAACGADDLSFAPVCPPVSIEPVLGDYYTYAGKPGQFSSLVVHASLTKVIGECAAAGRKNVHTRMGIHAVVMRGPAMKQETVTLPWFIAVVRGEKIVGKHVFTIDVTFPAGVNRVEVDSPLATIDLPIKPQNMVGEYAFSVGFQLTHEQLDYNREHHITAAFSPL